MVDFEQLKEVLRRTGEEKVVVVDGDETFVLMTVDAYAGDFEEYDEFEEDASFFEDINESPYAEEVLPELEHSVPEELAKVTEPIHEPLTEMSEVPENTEAPAPVFHEEPPVIPAGIQSENIRYEDF